MTIGSEGLVINPASTAYSDGLNQAPTQGRQGELIVSKVHGDYYTAAYRKGLFSFNRTAQTMPVVSSGCTSVFSLWNPSNSPALAELVDTDVGQVLSTDVVDVVGWYAASGSSALAGGFTTKAVAFGGASPSYFSARTGEIPNGNVQPFTSFSHTGGVPDRVDIVASFGATTDAVVTGGNGAGSKEYKGRLLLMPGTVISLLMSTAAGTASALDPAARWAEWPL